MPVAFGIDHDDIVCSGIMVVLPSSKVTLFEYLILDVTSNVFLVSMGETIVCIVLGEDVCLNTDSFVEGIDCQSQRIGNLLPRW